MERPVPRYVSIPAQHTFLFGPRGTGKSTWLRQVYGEAVWVDLLEPATLRRLEAQPERLREHVGPGRDAGTLVIDEIQKVPSLLPVVHQLIESGAQMQVVLTGSSARKLRSTGADLLGGRAGVRRLHPFMAAEMGGALDLEGALALGMLPVVRFARSPADALAGYIEVYLRQEVQAEALVRRIDRFGRFLEAISFSQGGVLNLTGVARECEVKRSTVGSFLGIVEDLLIAGVLPVFARRAQRQVVSHGKFYFFDCGVYRSLRPAGPLDRPEEIDGAALETLVYQHLRAWVDYTNRQDSLYFWRTRSGAEVDFVVYGPTGFWAIEVKNTDRIRRGDLRSLRSFRDEYPEATPLFLYRGAEERHVEGIACRPVAAFLEGVTPGAGLSR